MSVYLHYTLGAQDLTLRRFINGIGVDVLGDSERDEAGEEEGHKCVEMHLDFLGVERWRGYCLCQLQPTVR